MKVILKSKKDTHYAIGDFTEKGIKILKGSRINVIDSYPKMSDRVREIRKNRKVVDEEGVLLEDVFFNSPSSAAVFVTGRSTNGYISWRIDDKISLKEYYGKEKEV